MSSCHRRIPLCLQELPCCPPVRSDALPFPSLPITTWQGNERRASERWCLGSLEFIGATVCQHDRLLVSYAKEERKEGPRGISGLCSRQAQPAGTGQASQGLARAPAEGRISKQWAESIKAAALHLLPGPEQGSRSHRVRQDLGTSIPPFLFTDEETMALKSNLLTYFGSCAWLATGLEGELRAWLVSQSSFYCIYGLGIQTK